MRTTTATTKPHTRPVFLALRNNERLIKATKHTNISVEKGRLQRCCPFALAIEPLMYLKILLSWKGPYIPKW